MIRTLLATYRGARIVELWEDVSNSRFSIIAT